MKVAGTNFVTFCVIYGDAFFTPSIITDQEGNMYYEACETSQCGLLA
jgi:hypothetical protein